MPRVLRAFLRRIDPFTVGAFGLGLVGSIFGLGLSVEVGLAIAAVLTVATSLVEDQAKQTYLLMSGQKPLELGPGVNPAQREALDQINDLLSEIARERERVNDPELKAVLSQMSSNIKKYFQSSGKNKVRDVFFFKDRLTEVSCVLDKYIDVQENHYYYNEPRAELRKGKKAITDFSHYILQSVRRDHTADLIDYTVDTKILGAQR